MTCTNLISDNIAEYCGTWYGTNRNGFKAMFVNLANGPFSYDDVDNHETEGSFFAPWSELYVGYKIQWPKPPTNVS
jgi:hypothetical protein